MFEPLQHLNALRAFEATARLGSIRLAAKELNVTEGAISRHIKALEVAIGADVFIRAHRKLILTAQAEELAKSVSAAFETLIRSTDKFEQSVQSAQIVIACPGTFASRWLLPRLHLLEQRLKGSQIKVVTWNRDISASDRSIDLFLSVGAEPKIPGITSHVVAPETFGPVLTPALWAKTGSKKKLLGLRRLSANWPPSMWRNWASETGNALGEATTTRYERLIFAIIAAEAGIGLAIAPAPSVCDAVIAGTLVAPFGFHTRSGSWYVSWRSDRTSGTYLSAARWIEAEMQSAFDAMTHAT